MIMTKQKNRLESKDAHRTIKGILIGVILEIAAIALLSDISETKAAIKAGAGSVAVDNLISEERAEYMLLFGHGEQYDEEDMQ
jgi:hypothetical protein